MWAAVVGPSAESTESEGCGPQGARGTAQRGTGMGGAGCKGACQAHFEIEWDNRLPVNLLDGIIRGDSPNHPLLPPRV